MRIAPILKWVLGLGLVAYGGAVALLYVLQRDMLYRPPADLSNLAGRGRVSGRAGDCSCDRGWRERDC